MNPDSPKMPREEMETWLTSLLLGELSAGEAAAVRELIKHDPELAKLHDDLKSTIQLVREVTGKEAEPTPAVQEQLKLSAERREKLLAQFKTVAPKEFAPAKRRSGLRLVELAAALAIIAILAAMLLPALSKAKHTAQSVVVLNNLRQLDAAKQQWALEHKSSGNDAPTFEDIKPYLGRDDAGIPSVAGETYVLGKIGEPPSAEIAAADAKKTFGRFKASVPADGQSDRVRLFANGQVSSVGSTTLNRPATSGSSGTPGSPAKAPASEPAQTLAYYSLSAEGAQDYSAPAPTAIAPPPPRGATQIILPATSDTDSPNGPKENAAPTLSFANSSDALITGQPAAEPAWIGAKEAGQPQNAGNEPIYRHLWATPSPSFGVQTPAQQLQSVVDPATGLPIAGASEGSAGDRIETRAYDLSGRESLQREAEVSGDAFRRRYALPTSPAVPRASIAGGGGGGRGGAGPAEPNVVPPAVSVTAPENGSLSLSDTAGVTLKAVDEGKAGYFAGGQARGVTVEGADKFGPSSTTSPQPARRNVRGQIDELREGLKSGLSVDGAEESEVAQLLDMKPPEVKIHAKFTDATTNATSFNWYAGKAPVLGDLPVLGRTFTNSTVADDRWGDNSQQVKQGGAFRSGGAGITTDPEARRLVVVSDGQSPSNVHSLNIVGYTALPTQAGSSPATPQPLMESESLERYKALIPEREGFYAEQRGRLEQLKNLDKPQLRQQLADDAELRETSLGLKVAEQKLATLQKDPAVSATDLEQAQKQVADLKEKTDARANGVMRRLETQNVMLKSELESLKGSVATGQELDAKANKLDVDDAPAIRKPSTNAPVPQPEIQTSENNFSTFSLNVSDVSFKLAAAGLEKGQMPDPASVRSEEFINAFDYRDPEPAPGAPIAFAYERAHWPFAHNRDLLRFSLKTAAEGRINGRPLNLVLLLDNSGSMERADRVRIIREALRVLADQLQPQDKLSVITFSRTARLWVDGAPGSDGGAVAMAASEITPEGGTNLEEALKLGYETAARHYLVSGINRVVVLTDGAANLGDVEPESLKQKVEDARKQGIALDCFGIGWEGFNDDLLEVLSRNGDGRYGFINSPEEAASEFAGQLAGALKVAASDVKVQVEFNPRRVTSYRQIGYAKHQLTKEQFRDNTVDAAEIAAQEAGNALYTVEVNPAGAGSLCTVRVRYKIPGTSDYREQAWDVPYTGQAPSLEQSSPAMRLAGSAAAFSEWLVASPFAGDVSPDAVLNVLRGVPEVFGADSRPKTLESMIRQAKSIEGK